MSADISTLILKVKSETFNQGMKEAKKNAKSLEGGVLKVEKSTKKLTIAKKKLQSTVFKASKSTKRLVAANNKLASSENFATRAINKKTRALNRSRRATKKSSKATGLMKKAGIALVAAFTVKKLAIFSLEAIKAAANAEETANKFNEVFISIGAGADKAATALAKNFDIAGSTSRKLLGDTGDLLVGFGFSEKAALDLSVTVNELAGDLASFTNIEGGTARASKALTKMLVGETESAKELGIVVRQGTKEYKDRLQVIMIEKGVTILQAKALANLEIAVSQSQKAMGDYNRTSKSTSNLMKANVENAKDFKETFGGALKAILPVDEALKTWGWTLKTLTEPLRDISSLLNDSRERDGANMFDMFLPDLSGYDEGSLARKQSKEIFAERKAARGKEAADVRRSDASKIARLESLRLLSAGISKKSRLRIEADARFEKREAKAALERIARLDPLKRLKEEIRLRKMLNDGNEREVFIQRKLLSLSKNIKFTKMELNDIARAAGLLFDAEQVNDVEGDQSGKYKALSLAGAALKGSVEAARSTIGGAASIDEQIQKNTKTTAESTKKMQLDIRTMANNAAQPANIGY